MLKTFLENEKSEKLKQIVMDFFKKEKISFTDNSEEGKLKKKIKESSLYLKEWFILASKKAKKRIYIG